MVIRVIMIQLPSNDLYGNITNVDLSAFSNTLQILDFESNLLFGEINKSFYNLHLLHTLILEPKYTNTDKYMLKGEFLKI